MILLRIKTVLNELLRRSLGALVTIMSFFFFFLFLMLKFLGWKGLMVDLFLITFY